MSITAIVLAAGKGTRMKSELPKPLHKARGRALLGWVVTALAPDEFEAVSVVVGHGKDLVVGSLEEEFPTREFVLAEQKTQRGTGDAAAVGLQALDVAAPSWSDDDHVVVLPGDTPLLTAATIDALLAQHRETGAAATVVTTVLDDPTGYGRIVRAADGSVEAIVEHRDATEAQRRLGEINGGMYCFRRSLLAPALRMISTDNAQGELYLTDVVSVLAEAGHTVYASMAESTELAGVNDRSQLAAACEALGGRILTSMMASGVTVEQPSSTVVDAGVVVEPDATLRAGAILTGKTTVSAGAVIGPHSVLHDASVGAGAHVIAAVVDGGSVAAGARVGPWVEIVGG